MNQLEEISQKLIEINSPFTIHRILNDKNIACDFVEWVLLKIDDRLAVPSDRIGKLQMLAQTVASLGVCKITDTDLIDATAPHDRLINFYSNLLNVLKTSRIVLNEDDPFKIPNSVKPDDFKKSCYLIDSISKSCDLINKIVAKEFDLFPRDVLLMIGKEKPVESNKRKLDLSILQSMKEKNIQKLRILNAKSNCVQEEQARSYLDESDLDDQTHEDLSIIANDMSSKLKTFNEIYDEEISPWIKRDYIKHGGNEIVKGLGHQVQEANKRLYKIRNSLQDFGTMRKSYEEIVSHLPSIIEPQDSVNNNTSSRERNNLTNDTTNQNMIIINNRGESGLGAITRLQKVEKTLKDGVERRANNKNISLTLYH